MSNPLLDMLKKKKQERDAKGNDFRPWSPKAAKTVIRVLPSWRGAADDDGNANPFWHEWGQHWIKATDPTTGKPKVQNVFVCPDKTFEDECEICATVAQAVNIAKDRGDEAMESLLKESFASQKFLLNVQVLSGDDKSNKAVVMSCGPMIFDAIISLMTEYAEEGVDITDLETGIDLVVGKSGSGFDTKYTVMASPKGARKTTLEGELHDLDAIIAGEMAKNKEQKALAGVARAAGVELPAAGTAAAAAIEAPATSALDDAEIEDAEFEEAPAVAAEAAAEVEEAAPAPAAEAEAEPEIEDDELADLMAELEAG